MRGLPKVIGQGIYKRENPLHVPEYAGGGESRERERTRESMRVTGMYVVWCGVLLLLRLFSGTEGESLTRR